MTAIPGRGGSTVGGLTPGTAGQAVITRSGTAVWDEVEITDVNGLTAALAAKPTTIAGQSDFAGTPTNNQVLAYSTVSSKWGPATISAGTAGTVTPLALDDLTDATISSPALNDILKYNGSIWLNSPGASLTQPYHTPEDHGAAGDLVSTVTGLSITSGSGTATFVGAAFVSGDVGKLIIGNFGVGGATKVAQIKARIDATHVTLCPPGTPGGTYTAQSTVTTGPGAFYSQSATTAGRSKDGVAFQAMLTAARASGLPMILTTGARYAIDVTLDISNWPGFRMFCEGGRSYIVSSGVINTGGAVLCAVAESPIVVLSSVNTQINHNGTNVENVGFVDPCMKFQHTAGIIHYQTRWRWTENCWVGFAVGLRLVSGQKDISWGWARGNTSVNSTIHYQCFNQFESGTGAMAIEISGGDLHVLANQTGVDWYGGQYGKVNFGKVDQDGANSKVIRLRNSGAFPSAGLMEIGPFGVEAGTTNALDSESVVIDIEAGVSKVNIRDVHVGGGGSAANGTTVRMIGTGSGARVENILISGGYSRAREVGIIFGPWTRNCRLENHTFTAAGGGLGKFVRADANSQNCRVASCNFDSTANPLANVAQIDVSAATRFYIDDMTWSTDRSMLPQFAGIVPAGFGSNGDSALANTSTTAVVQTKKAGVWS